MQRFITPLQVLLAELLTILVLIKQESIIYGASFLIVNTAYILPIIISAIFITYYHTVYANKNDSAHNLTSLISLMLLMSLTTAFFYMQPIAALGIASTTLTATFSALTAISLLAITYIKTCSSNNNEQVLSAGASSPDRKREKTGENEVNSPQLFDIYKGLPNSPFYRENPLSEEYKGVRHNLKPTFQELQKNGKYEKYKKQK